jgi:ABC-type Na+ efflux pump permease subunit
VQNLQPGRAKSAAVVGLILIFVTLAKYNTSILIGVMEEKSSRVIEVLLAALRPIQLLTGKVLGIGVVAFAQASLIVAFALVFPKVPGPRTERSAAPSLPRNASGEGMEECSTVETTGTSNTHPLHPGVLTLRNDARDA